MASLLVITALLFIVYSLLILYCWRGWRSIPDFSQTEKISQTKISVIIPARNEQDNIGPLLQALQEQTYPKELFEIIVIDDHSDDGTAGEVKKFPEVKLIELKETGINSYKKKAIETGIEAASGELIVTTDADCLPGKSWLNVIALFKEEKNAVFISAPVVLQNNSSLLQIFQSLDFLILQGVTGAAVHKNLFAMCNGANLSYEKRAFFEVGGFSKIDAIASGDDMLLMHKVRKKYPLRIFYLKSKEAIVSTQPMKTWKEFFDQRIRWASKARYYQDKKIFWVLLMVYLFNLSFFALLVVGFRFPILWLYLIALMFAKTIIEFPFIYSMASFFNKRSLLKYFFFFQPLHIVYTVLAGFLGQLGKYEWKGRRVK